MWWILLGVCGAVCGTVGWIVGRRSVPQQVQPPIVNTPPTPSEAERQLLRIVEALPLGVLVFDNTGERLFANGAADALVADRLHTALVASAVAEVVEEAGSLADQAATRVLELYGPGRTHLSIRGVPVAAGVVGQSAVVVTIEDVTEVRSADLLRREFVANVSHELKTPIGAIGLLAETLLDVDDPTVARRLAERLQNEAFRLAATVDGLLTLARIESGEHTPLAPIRLDDVLAAVIGREATHAEARGVEVRVHLDPPDLAVMGDRVQLISGFGNLVDNAVKYSGKGSEVTVLGWVEGQHATVTVQDRGIGIPEADLERIFERFYRVGRGRSRDSGGTGLGLSIVRHVLRNHAGSIDVESVEGEGTTFTVKLPAVADETVDRGERSSVDGV